MTKRGQFEIMGIAIIVAILVFGILIFFVLGQGNKPENIVKQYSNTEFAQNFVNVLLRTTAESCNGNTVQDLIIDCAGQKQITCGSISSCDKSKEIAQKALTDTLSAYNKQYKFTAARGTTGLIEISSPNPYSCTQKERPGRQPLPDNILLTLEICG